MARPRCKKWFIREGTAPSCLCMRPKGHPGKHRCGACNFLWGKPSAPAGKKGR